MLACGAPAWALQDDGTINKPLKSAKNKTAPVNTGDLMSAMRQTLSGPVPPPPSAPVASSVPSEPLPPPVAQPALVPKQLPPTPPAPVAASTAPSNLVQNDILIPAPGDKPAVPSVPTATVDKPAPKNPVSTATTPPPASSAAPAVQSNLATGGAPLLSDVDEPPNILGAPQHAQGVEPGSVPEAATASSEAKTEYAHSRPLFGKKNGGKRAGVAAKQKVTSDALVPVDETVPAPAPKAEAKTEPKPAEKASDKPAVTADQSATMPPMKSMIGATDASVPPPAGGAGGTSSSGSLTPPSPSSTEGAVIYSQKAGENPPAPTSAPVLPPTPDKPPVVSEDIIAHTPPTPEAAPENDESLFVPAPPDTPSARAKPIAASHVIRATPIVAVVPGAQCGAAQGTGTYVQPSRNLCAKGRPTNVLGNGPWLWSCQAEGGQAVDCTAPLFVSGMCGLAADNLQRKAPIIGLCRFGTASPVTGTGPWYWTCNGAGGGGSVSCNAFHVVEVAQTSFAAPTADFAPVPPPPPQSSSESTTGVVIYSQKAGSVQAPALPMAQMPSPDTVAVPPPLFQQVPEFIPPPAPAPMPQPLPATAPPTNILASTDYVPPPAPPQPVPESVYSPSAVAVQPIAPAPVYQQPAMPESVYPPMAVAIQPSVPATPVPVEPVAPPVAVSVQPPAPAPVPEAPAKIVVTQKSEADCTPDVRQWTITCQQGGYPANYAGVITGETQKLCPTGTERGVWLSNTCTPTTDSAPVSPEPGVLVKPERPDMVAVADVLPDVSPLPPPSTMPAARSKLKTPHFKGAPESAVTVTGKTPSKPRETSVYARIMFGSDDSSLDANAVGRLNDLVGEVGSSDRIISLDAYAMLPTGGDQQQSQRLSLARALAVRTYLISRGIANNRIDVRALGPASDTLGADRVDIKLGG